jgi:hypothetical protein
MVGALTASVYPTLLLKGEPVPVVLSVALMVIGKVPLCVGVPERIAVAALKVTPVGNVPVSAHV